MFLSTSRNTPTIFNRNLLPKGWTRYVDDVFAIVKKCETNNILDLLNQQSESIKFTIELELKNKISFLDLLLTNINKKIEISVFHKPTATDRYITNDSNCPMQHKMAAFHSMVYRLCKLPLSIKNFNTEYEHIKRVAEINGFSADLIDRLIKKHSIKIRKSSLSTLFAENRKIEKNCHDEKRVCLTYIPEITDKLKTVFKQNNLRIVYSSKNKLKDLFGSTKDKIENLDKTGIYKVSCNECQDVYIGQTRRKLKTRFKEHLSHIKYNRPLKSSVAAHVLNNSHFDLSWDNIQLKKQVNDQYKLDAYESAFIYRENNLMNSDDGNVISSLFQFI